MLNDVINKYDGKAIGTYHSEMKDFHIYSITYNNTPLCIVQAVVASGSIAMMTEAGIVTPQHGKSYSTLQSRHCACYKKSPPEETAVAFPPVA